MPPAAGVMMWTDLKDKEQIKSCGGIIVINVINAQRFKMIENYLCALFREQNSAHK